MQRSVNYRSTIFKVPNGSQLRYSNLKAIKLISSKVSAVCVEVDSLDQRFSLSSTSQYQRKKSDPCRQPDMFCALPLLARKMTLRVRLEIRCRHEDWYHTMTAGNPSSWCLRFQKRGNAVQHIRYTLHSQDRGKTEGLVTNGELSPI